MKLLIVEDQADKRDEICGFFHSIYEEVEFDVASSLRSGLKLLISKGADLVVLDMSMPNFDPENDNPKGGSPESFAGKEFLAQMSLREIKIKTVVVSQYALFEKGQISLMDLDKMFSGLYSDFYLGSVYYSSANDEWKNQLHKIIKGF